MSNIDKQVLRQLAVDAKELATIKRYTKGIEAQKKFIAAMTPALVLALLDELEEAQAERDKFKFAFTEWHNKSEWVQKADADRFSFISLGMHRADVMTRHIECLESTIEREREKSRRVMSRIAELEANEIREEDNQFLIVRHPGKTPTIKHATGDLNTFLKQLMEHDPLITIDIVTHRYYGAGGQLVQDADEYLACEGIAMDTGE